jgi:hypothetical protein
MRVLCTGPLFRKLGARVVYARVDLDAWADARTVSMTGELPEEYRSGRR